MGAHTEVGYCYPALNTSCPKIFRTQRQYAIMYTLLFFISASTVFLNLLVIISVAHFKQLQTPTNLLILSLAVADLHVGLLVMPVDAGRLIETCWYLGDSFCYIFPVIINVVISASLGNMMFISVDRYIAVSNPLNYYSFVTVNKAVLCTFLNWCGSLAYAVIMLSEHLQSKRIRRCHGECLLFISFPFLISDIVFSFVAPCLIVICLYLKIFCMAKYQARVMNNIKIEHASVRKSENKAAKTLGILVTVYLCCWIPYCLSLLTLLTSAKEPSPYVILTFVWCVYMNSFVNPLIYALFYPWFRVSVKYILTLSILDPASRHCSLHVDGV